jgi:hypothetical protein
MDVKKKKTRSLKLSLALFVCLFFTVGCGVQENFDYRRKDRVEFPWGHFSAGLQGSEKVGFFKVTRGSPYEFWSFIIFDKRKHMEGFGQLTELRLINARTNKLLVELDKPIEKPIRVTMMYGGGGEEVVVPKPNAHEVYLGVYKFLRFEDQRSEYDDIILQAKFIIKEGGNEEEYSVEMLLEKNYKKEFSHIFQ